MQRNKAGGSALTLSLHPRPFSYAQQPAPLLHAQHPAQLLPQQPLQPLCPAQPPFGQLVPHCDAAEVDEAEEASSVSVVEDTEASWVHEPTQFAPHTDCEHAVPLGQLQFPPHDCPKVNPIPANSRTIDTIAANFFIRFSPLNFVNSALFTTGR